MSRKWAFLFLPLLSLACSMVLYEQTGSGMVGTGLPPLSTTTITTTTSPGPQTIELAIVCNVKAEIGLNFRSGAGTDAPVLIVLPDGTLVQVVESKVVEDGGTWKKVVEGSGMIGWVNGKYLCEYENEKRSNAK